MFFASLLILISIWNYFYAIDYHEIDLGLTADEMVKCDMIAEAVRDLLSLVTSAPFKRKYYQPPLAIEDASPVTPATGVPAVAASSSTSTSLTTVTPAASNSARTVSIANTTPTSAAFPPIPPSPRTAGALTVLPPAPYDNSLQHDPSDPRWQEHLQTMRTKWSFIGQRFEAILRSNKMQLLAQQRHLGTKGSRFTGSVTPALANAPAAAVTTVTPVVATAASGSSQRKSNTPSIAAPAMDEVNYLVGSALTYADILVAHVTTWYVEECGPEIVADMPMLIALQNAVISLPGITRYIKSIHYFPLGDRLYIEQVPGSVY